MKTTIKYVNDHNGNTRAIQLSIKQWTHLVNKINKYEEMLAIKSDPGHPFGEVKKNHKEKIKKQ
jgi:hypothetical protein